MTSTTGSATPITSPQSDHAPVDNRRRDRLVVNLLLVSAFVVVLNETVMSVAIPRLMIDLSITATAAQWLTTAFLLTMAVVIPVTGFLLQRFTTRQLYIAAMTLFILGTLVASVSPGFEMLVVARVIQASGTAIMVPLLMTTAMTLEPPATRGRRMGSITIVISVAPAIGPTISGLILNALPWRFLFVIMVPIALAALILGVIRMKNVSDTRSTPLDVASVALSALGFGGIVFGLSHIGEAAGNIGPVVIIPLVIGALALAGFIVRQLRLQRYDQALLDLRTFKSTIFTLSVVVFAISTMAFFGALILLPLYMQNVLGFDVLQSGLMLLPGGLVMGLSAPVIGRLFDRIGPRPLVVPGGVLITLALAGLSLLSTTTPWWMLLPLHIVFSLGLSLTITPLFSASLGSLPAHLYSHGSATISTAQQVAGAVGTAVFISVMTATTLAATTGGAAGITATADGLHAAFLVAAATSVLGLVFACFLRKPRLHA